MNKQALKAAVVLSVVLLTAVGTSLTTTLPQSSTIILTSNGTIKQPTPTTNPTPTPHATPRPTPSPTSPTRTPQNTPPPPSDTPAPIQTNQTTDPQTGTIMFSGYEWDVENSGANRLWKPGPNHWSSSANNIWVDGNGWLHLQITNTDGIWYCAELTTIQTLGYGTYRFGVSNNVVGLDKNVVLGLFAYKDDIHEVDIEFSTWSGIRQNNSWYTIQPEPNVRAVIQDSFSPQLQEDFSTHYFTWAPHYVYFESWQGDTLTNPSATSIIHSFNSSVSPDAADAKAHINLWLNKGQVPSDQKNVEIVIKNFTFTPLVEQG